MAFKLNIISGKKIIPFLRAIHTYRHIYRFVLFMETTVPYFDAERGLNTCGVVAVPRQ